MQTKRILIICDKRDWAFDQMVKSLTESLTDNYTFYFAYLIDYQIEKHYLRNRYLSWKHNIKSFLRLALGFDTKVKIHNFSVQYCYVIHKKPVVFNSENEQHFFKNFDLIVEMDYYSQYCGYLPFSSKKKMIGIYTESYPHSGENFDFKNRIEVDKLDRALFFDRYLNHYDYLLVGSNNLKRTYEKYTKNVSVVNSVLKQLNFESNVLECDKKQDKFVIGWTGNPTRNFKGFYDIIEPAIDELKKEGLNIELKTKFSGPYEELFSFFDDVNLLVIASEGDCGPAVFAHASLSNVPTLSTNIGWPSDVIIDGVNGFFCDRNIDSFKEKIRVLYADRILLNSFSKRICNDYKNIYDNIIFTENFNQTLTKVFKP